MIYKQPSIKNINPQYNTIIRDYLISTSKHGAKFYKHQPRHLYTTVLTVFFNTLRLNKDRLAVVRLPQVHIFYTSSNRQKHQVFLNNKLTYLQKYNPIPSYLQTIINDFNLNYSI